MSIQIHLDDGSLTHEAWARALEEGTLLGKACTECEHVTAAPKAACTRCGSRDADVVELSTEGEVYAETTVHVPPEAFADEEPYGVAIVDLGDARVMAKLTAEADIGESVELRGYTDEDESPGPLFGPVVD